MAGQDFKLPLRFFPRIGTVCVSHAGDRNISSFLNNSIEILIIYL